MLQPFLVGPPDEVYIHICIQGRL